MGGLKPARLFGAFEEPAHDREQLRLLEQEGIVPLVGDDSAKDTRARPAVEGRHDGARIGGWKRQSEVKEMTQNRVGVSLNALASTPSKSAAMSK